MPTLPRRRWAEMSSLEFSQLDHERVIAVLPVAAIEQHGPHLPVAVDTCIMDGIVQRVIELAPEALPVTFLPTQAIGKSNEHARYPGTLTFSAETLIRNWMELGDCVAATGIRKLILFNSHGGQLSVMDIVSRDLREAHEMLVVTCNWFSLGIPEGLFSGHEMEHGIHAGSVETSMMLALMPERVDMSKAEPFGTLTETLAAENKHLSLRPGGKLAWQSQDLNPKGAMGDATDADAERGRLLVDHAAREFITLLEEMDRYPLERLDNDPAWR